MKKAILVSITLLLSQLSYGYKATSECDLVSTDFANEDAKLVRSISVDSAEKLTELQAWQVSELAEGLDEYDSDFHDINDAIEMMNESQGDLTIGIYRIGGRIYSRVTYFPGDNEFGLVFKGRELIGQISDGDLLCD